MKMKIANEVLCLCEAATMQRFWDFFRHINKKAATQFKKYLKIRRISSKVPKDAQDLEACEKLIEIMNYMNTLGLDMTGGSTKGGSGDDDMLVYLYWILQQVYRICFACVCTRSTEDKYWQEVEILRVPGIFIKHAPKLSREGLIEFYREEASNSKHPNGELYGALFNCVRFYHELVEGVVENPEMVTNNPPSTPNEREQCELDRQAGEEAWRVRQEKQREYDMGYKLGREEGEYGYRIYDGEGSGEFQRGYEVGYKEAEEDREFNQDAEY